MIGTSLQGCTRTVPTAPPCYFMEVKKDSCGCISEALRLREPCIQKNVPQCNECQDLVNATDECGCEKMSCQNKLCPSVATPTCNDCQHLEVAKDSCGCLTKARCIQRPCINNAIPHCNSCQNLLNKVDGCGCKQSYCQNKKCPPLSFPSCPNCKRLTTKKDSCGCVVEARCVSKPCPATSRLSCPNCYHVQKSSDSCGCELSHCSKTSCPATRNCGTCHRPQYNFYRRSACNCPAFEGCKVSKSSLISALAAGYRVGH